MNSTRHNIEQLHDLYVALTKHSIFLNPARERDWFEWLRFRSPAFTADDLRAVIAHLQRGIRDTKRNPGALKFSNLIGNPDYFEEDLAEARAIGRKSEHPTFNVQRSTLNGKTTERRIPATGAEPTACTAAQVLDSLNKLKAAAK